MVDIASPQTVDKNKIAAYYKALQSQYDKKYPFLKNWRLVFDQAKRRAGACFYLRKTISISVYHVENNDWRTIEDTIKHELAHALAYEVAGEKGHGIQWRKFACELGATPKASGKFETVEAPWILVYIDDEQQELVKVAERFRRNRRINKYAVRGKSNTLGKLFYITHIEYRRYLNGELVVDYFKARRTGQRPEN